MFPSMLGQSKGRIYFGGNGMKKRLFSCCLLFLMAGCDQGKPKEIEVKLHNASGDEVGTAKVVQQTSGVKITIKGEGFTPGYTDYMYMKSESVRHLVLNHPGIILILMIKTWSS